MTLLRAFVKFLIKRKERHARFFLLTQLGKQLVPEYRFNWPYIDWWKDTFFDDYLARFGELDGFNTDKRLMLYQLMRLTDGVAGDTAECGTLDGAGSYFISLMNDRCAQPRWHHIFDSFEGLSAPDATDGDYWKPGDLSVSMDKVRTNLSDCEHLSLYKGWIPDRFKEVSDKHFSFVHIDVDLYQPTLDSMAFFYSRMNPGAIILCDDYGSSVCPGATLAVNEFLEDKLEKMVYLPGSGGFMIKSCSTSRQLQ